MYFGSVVMPPRTRTRAAKIFKENVDIVRKTKGKRDGKITKPPRKALADKTNSLSDDNASIDVPIKTKVALKNKEAKSVSKDGVRPRRDRRLPTRYVENQVLINLSNNKENNQVSDISGTCTSLVKPASKKKSVKQNVFKNTEVELASRPKRNCRLQSSKEPSTTKKPETPSKQSNSTSPFKTPSQSFNSSLVANKPKRICRLPSRFEDNSISPNRFIPVIPCHASTPIVRKIAKQTNVKTDDSVTKPGQRKPVTRKTNKLKKDQSTKDINHYFTETKTNKKTDEKNASSSSKDKTSPDSNNNPKSKRILAEKVLRTRRSPKISPKANIKVGLGERLLEKNHSFRVFEDRRSKDKDEDIYEFTYDPNEEPTPQKKKRKKVVKKRPPKSKTVLLKNNYEKNLKITLESLKNKVKPSQPQNNKLPPSQITQPQQNKPQNVVTDINPAKKIEVIEDIILKPATENKTLNYTPALPVNDSAKSIHMSNYASIRVEDIAADFETSDQNYLNYSPVSSPRPKTPSKPTEDNIHTEKTIDSHITVNNKDPLNLQGDASFFDQHPVASSSMNVSVRDPLASPWRVEFGNLPIRWQANTYVKPNMTPAVESSFINSEDLSKKKHVYTNLLVEDLPQTEEPPNLKQTSIISFMKEVAERSLKKKRGRSISPAKANSLFEDSDTSNFGFKTPKKARKEVSTPNASNSSHDKSKSKEASKLENQDNSNHEAIPNEDSIANHENNSPTKKSKQKDATFFGFDESESFDQENVSPIKNIRHTRARGLRAKSRGVLREINAISGPTRAVLPKPKLASLKVVEQLYDQLKSAEDAPILEKNVDEPFDDDGPSVHLFEDIEVVHHLKPQRKSYGKAKKVTFRHRLNSDSDTQTQDVDTRSSDEDDLSDLTFYIPNVKERKVTKKKPKKQLSKKEKKEEQEVEQWAANFNSMCEDIDEFPLVLG